MIDKFFYWLFSSVDKMMMQVDKILIPKPKRKKRNRCKICHCKCHCKDGLHSHWYDKDLCVCDTCRH
jgi:hypothetical protein